MKYLLTLILCLFTTVVWAASHKVIVKLETNRSSIRAAQADVLQILRGTDFTIKRRYAQLPYIALTCDDEGISRMEFSRTVLSITPDEEFFPVLAQSIPLIGADTAHRAGHLGQGYTVAILDTGVESGHAAFGGRVVAEACFTDAPQCPNGTDTEIGPGAGAPCLHTSCYHGTHVADIAVGALGVAPRADLVSIQIFTIRSSGGLSSSFSDIMAGIEHVAVLAQGGMKIASINMSLGTGPITGDCTSSYQGIADAVALAEAQLVGTIAASGNNGSSTGISSPGCIRSVVAVGSTTKTDSISTFSNRGPEMDLWAPGQSIVAARLGGGTRSLSGTSMSSPHTAGAYALIQSMFPNPLSPDNVRTMVKFFGVDVQGRPRLRVDNIQAPTPPPPDPNEPQCPDCPPNFADEDGDGEMDSRDRCPGTPKGEPIDDAGCSREQWCATITPGSWRARGDCRALDFLNDEPRNAKDCRVDRRGWGSADDACVPR